MEKKIATFAGGCFWCIQKVFDDQEGVISTFVGYTGGDEKNPTYEDVCSGSTKHVEGVQVFYDPEKVSFKKLLEVFWNNIDPKNFEGQFSDKGSQYLPVIFFEDDEQERCAIESKEKIENEIGKTSVKILPVKTFYKAEDYHQEYYKKCPVRYRAYEIGSGRKNKLEFF